MSKGRINPTTYCRVADTMPMDNKSTFILIAILSLLNCILFANASSLDPKSGGVDPDSDNGIPDRRNIVLTNEIDENPDTCAQLSQVQSVVIQLLASHYEYNKGKGDFVVFFYDMLSLVFTF